MNSHRITFNRPKHDLTGEIFGRLKVIGIGERKSPRKFYWLCRCECSNMIIVDSSHLLSGATKSCGCLKREVSALAHKTHGKSRTPEYNVYLMAKRRCTIATDKSFPDYGGRGIKFLFSSFEEFYNEVGPRPLGMTLERKNNDGHYSPGNVCWATRQQQRANQRCKRLEQFTDEQLIDEIIRRGGWSTILAPFQKAIGTTTT
jgi:hypothetical protein